MGIIVNMLIPVMRGDRARRLGAIAPRNGGCARIEEP
jgi:hypothetical protein